MEAGKVVHLKKFPKGRRLKLFSIVKFAQCTDYAVTNDYTQDSVNATREESAICWKIEQFHWGAKQAISLESSQRCSQHARHNSIAYSMFVWIRLNQIIQQTQKNAYQIKAGVTG